MEETARQTEVAEPMPHIVIGARGGWGKVKVGEVWSFRNLIWTLIWRDIKTRYRQRALGPLWMILGPFISLLISSFIFGTVAGLGSDGVPYMIFFFTGTLTWGFFGVIYGGTLASLGSFMGWMQKIYVPRLMAPIVTVGCGLVDWAIQLSILAGLMIYFQISVGWAIFAAPLYLLMAVIIGGSIGLWASAISVKFRDFPELVSYGMSAWYFATPVLYSARNVPDEFRWLYELNPMYWVVEGIRWSVLGIGRQPELYMLIPFGAFMLLFYFSIHVFLRTSRNVVDIQ